MFPDTTLQTCIVHLIRNSLEYASWKERRTVAAALKPVYTATSAEAALAELAAFEQGYPPIAASRHRAWDQVIPFFTFPPAIRKIIYTMNAIESIEAQLRKIIETRGYFRSDQVAVAGPTKHHGKVGQFDS